MAPGPDARITITQIPRDDKIAPDMEATSASHRKPDSFARNVIKLVGGTTLAQIITVISAPILSRLYEPHPLGTTGVFISMVTIISVIVCLRYEQAIMLPKDDEEAANLFAVSLVFTGVISLAAWLIAWLGRSYIVALLNAPEIGQYLTLVPLAVLVQGIFLATNFWNSRQKHFGRLSVARIAASFSTSVIPILMAILGYANTTGLIISYVIGTSIFTLVLLVQVLGESRKQLRQSIRATRMLDGLIRYRKFPLFDVWGAVINTLSWQLPILMFSAYFSQVEVGYYSMASRVILLPMTLVGNAVAQVFFQRASETMTTTRALAQPVEMVFRRLAGISLAPAIVLLMLGPELFLIVFGSNWLEAGVYAQILAPWMFFLFISSPISTLFAVLEKQELAFFVHLSILVSRILSLYYGGESGNVHTALGLWTGTGIVVYGGLAVWNLRLAGVPWRSLFSTLGRYLPLAVPLAAALYGLKLIANGNPWIIILGTSATAGIYYAWMIRQDHELYQALAKMAGFQRDSKNAAIS